MFCKTCGKELQDSAKFCNWCGTKVELLQSPSPTEYPGTKSSGKKCRKHILIGTIVLLAILGVGGYGWYSHVNTWEYQFTKAMEYRDQGEREKAITAFQKAIECDPLNVTAYHRLSEIYARIGDNSASEQILRQCRIARGRTDASSIFYNNDGKIIGSYIANYDDQGRCVIVTSDNYGYVWPTFLSAFKESLKNLMIQPQLVYATYSSDPDQTFHISLEERMFYDANGQLRQLVGYDVDGSIHARYDYEYTDDNRIKEVNYSDFKFSDSSKTEYEYSTDCITSIYRDDHQTIKSTNQEESDKLTKGITEISIKNNDYYYLVECESHYSVGGVILSRDMTGTSSNRYETNSGYEYEETHTETFEYEESGNLIKQTKSDSATEYDPEQTYWCEFQYDANGDLVAIKVYDADDGIVLRGEFTYTDTNPFRRS